MKKIIHYDKHTLAIFHFTQCIIINLTHWTVKAVVKNKGLQKEKHYLQDRSELRQLHITFFINYPISLQPLKGKIVVCHLRWFKPFPRLRGSMGRWWKWKYSCQWFVWKGRGEKSSIRKVDFKLNFNFIQVRSIFWIYISIISRGCRWAGFKQTYWWVRQELFLKGVLGNFNSSAEISCTISCCYNTVITKKSHFFPCGI